VVVRPLSPSQRLAFYTIACPHALFQGTPPGGYLGQV
jgi:hypothetical protein